jgi:hypothetical protein
MLLHYKGGPEMAQAIRDLELPVVDVPAYPVPTAGAVLDPGAEYLWRHGVTEAKKRITQLAENLKRAHALIIGQCSEDLLGKIKGSSDYPAADTDQDAVKLLLIIRGAADSTITNRAWWRSKARNIVCRRSTKRQK